MKVGNREAQNYLFCFISMRAAEAEDPHFLSEITERQNAGSFFLSFTQPICLFDVSHWCLAQKTQQFLTNIPLFKMTKWDGNINYHLYI